MSSIYRVNIDQQLAELGVRTTPARLKISTPRMKMKITSEAPQLEIERQAPKFKLNRKKIGSGSGFKAPAEVAQNYRSRGRAAASRGQNSAVGDGNILDDAKKQSGRVSQLTKNKPLSAIQKNKEQIAGSPSRSRPEVVWDKGSLSINWSRHSILIDWDGEFMPQLTVDPKHSVEVYLRTEPYFRVTVEEMVVPGTPGRYVDQAI